MSGYEHIEVERSEGEMGSAIRGVDLRKGLSEGEAKEVRREWLERSVVHFPGQVGMGPGDMERFAEAMGGFGEDEYIVGLEGHPHVAEVKRGAEEKAERFGAPWHTDWSYQATPPSATVLYGRVIPPVGGRTSFASGYMAWDGLSAELKEKAERKGLKAVHSAQRSYAPDGFYAEEGKERSMKVLSSERAYETLEHPVVRTHPETGRKALWVNSVYTIGLSGGDMSDEEREELLEELLKESTRKEYVHKHKWEAGTLLMWDNRCVQHRAEGGYDGYAREMMRVVVAGDAPY